MTQRNSATASALWALWDQVGIENTTQVRRGSREPGPVSQHRESVHGRQLMPRRRPLAFLLSGDRLAGGKTIVLWWPTPTAILPHLRPTVRATTLP